MQPQKTVIIIAGPTAIGKTAMAIELAQHFNTEIISADSRQCYQELNIGVAKPANKELQAVHHYFINSHSIRDKVDAAVFEKYALKCAAEIFKTHDTAVMVGGTGMYIKAFCEGLDDIPAIDELLRESIKNEYMEKGLQWLQETIEQEDQEYHATGEIKNPQRLLRALEVKRATGRSIRSYQQKQPVERAFNTIKIGLEMPRELLIERINHRVDIMIADGLFAEVEGLLPYHHLNALQTVGYKEIFEHFAGLASTDATIESIKINTRQYAKRQMTWFKRDEAMHWFGPAEKTQLLDHVHQMRSALR